jgi:hypothetical protein
MADPVSWLMIEPGWRVEDSTGANVGRVLEVVGDSNADIFDGLAIASSAVAKPRYVPAEQVGEIVDGCVRVKLAERAIDALPEYQEPPVEEDIEPEKAPLADRVESAVVPPSTRSSDIPLVRRVLLWFGLTGRR